MQGFFVYQLCIRRDKPKNRFHAMMRSMNTTKHTGFLFEVTTFPHLLPCNFYLQFMYRSNGSFNMPPPGNPRAFDFFENYCSNSPLPGPKCRSNAPHWGPFRWSNAPTPGTFHRHKNDRKTVETPSVVEQNLYKHNKNWETLLAYLLRTKVSCKAVEITATR